MCRYCSVGIATAKGVAHSCVQKVKMSWETCDSFFKARFVFPKNAYSTIFGLKSLTSNLLSIVFEHRHQVFLDAHRSQPVNRFLFKGSAMFLQNPLTRLITWSLTFAVVAHAPLLSAEERITGETTGSIAPDIDAVEPVVRDVQLRAEGNLTARIVNLQGHPVTGEQVLVIFQGKNIATVVSDDDGLVAVRGLRPGLHAIVTSTSTTACRFWNADSAPPSAAPLPAIVSDEEIIRGQAGGGFGGLLVLGIAAGALVVALDAKNTADDAKSSNTANANSSASLIPASP